MSFGHYTSGQIPNIRPIDLRSLLLEFSEARKLAPELASATGGRDGVFWCRADYHMDDDFIRVWYISDSKSVALATYVCNLEHRDVEVLECDRIVDSVRFIYS
jgi:hypothetical protein